MPKTKSAVQNLKLWWSRIFLLNFFFDFDSLSAFSAVNENKKPQPLRGKSWGLIDPIKYPPFPAEGLRDQSELERFPGLRLPNPHAFPDFSSSGWKKLSAITKLLAKEICWALTADCFFSCGFRSAHSCGAAVDLYHFPLPSRGILKNLGNLLQKSFPRLAISVQREEIFYSPLRADRLLIFTL